MKNKTIGMNNNKKRGKVSKLELQGHARYVLRHLGDPGVLQGSPFCKFSKVVELGKEKYPTNTIPNGLALKEIILECLQDLENEMDGHFGMVKLKDFITHTREGKGVAEASRAIEVTPAYGCRTFKRRLVELLAKKLLIKVHSR